MPGMRIIGWGAALPDKTVTNADLEARLDTSDAWIRERTGIRERRVGDSTTDLAVEAGRAAIETAGVAPGDVDLVILCTTTPDQTMPATAAHVQARLGTAGAAMDLNVACSGFVYGLVTADGLARSGVGRTLLIGAETLSRIVDWGDRNTAVLFGDGGGAVLVERTDGPGQLLSFDLGGDGTTAGLLYADLGDTMKMDGKEIFRRAVRASVQSAEAALEKAGVTAGEIDLLLAHQANVRIIDAACQRLGIPIGRAAMVLDRTGNTSAASIPLALVDAIESDRLTEGSLVLVSGFGAGMSWASAVLRWGGPT